jgi:hypothetical protein
MKNAHQGIPDRGIFSLQVKPAGRKRGRWKPAILQGEILFKIVILRIYLQIPL